MTWAVAIGRPFLSRTAVPMVVDIVLVALYVWYLLGTQRVSPRRKPG